MHPGNFGTAFIWAVVPAVVLLLVIYGIDRYEKEPVRLLALALLFGAILAPLVAFLIQKAAGVPTSMVVQDTVPRSRLNVSTPIIEEAARGLAVLAVFFLVRYEIDGLLDGLVYGAVVGIGFAMSANFIAILDTPSFGGSTNASLFSAMVAGLNHLFYAGVVGLALAAVRNRSRNVVFGAALVGIGVAMGFHLLHDYLPWWLASSATNASGSTLRRLVSDIPNTLGLVALGAIATWSAAGDAALVAGELKDEVASGVVTPEDYTVVTHGVRRASTLLFTLLGKGEREWRLRRTLYTQEVELAYRKRRRRSGAAPDRHLIDENVYRARIAEARRQLSSLSQPSGEVA